MGATSSSVTSGVKDQVDSGSRALYKWADLAGGGELVRLTKEAIKTNDFTELDETIEREMPQLLYEGGLGKHLPMYEVISTRHKERTGNQLPTPFSTEDRPKKKFTIIPMSKQARKDAATGVPTKEVCWSVTQRGGVGETLLHVCFLCGSSLHMVLAKRLLLAFPKLINDVYLSDEYYGENVLHMGIVNEDPQIVRFLIDKGVNVHQRCCGNFFTPDDQKASRGDSWDHEWVDLSLASNYNGHMYWGEYPVSFAAVLNQEECFRLLVAKGADPNKQDTNGNTVLHIMVIHENPDMFDLGLLLKANLHTKNRQGLTPLTLAAKLAKHEMFDHVLDVEKDVYWEYGDVICAAYPLEYTDSIDPQTGQVNWNSALALVVYGESVKHLQCINSLLEEMLRKKWTTFARKKLIEEFAIFVLYFILAFIAFFLRPSPALHAPYKVEEDLNTINFTEAEFQGTACHMWGTLDQKTVIRIVIETFVVLGAVGFLTTFGRTLHSVGIRNYMKSLLGFPARTTFLCSCVLILLMVPLRAACSANAENVVGIIAILLLSSKLLFFCRGWKMTGPVVLATYRIMMKDLTRFFLIYFVFVFGFSQSFFVIFLGSTGLKSTMGGNATEVETQLLSNFFESFNRMFMMSLNEFGEFFDKLHNCKLATLGKIMFMVYIMLVAVLLVNMLIAMMTQTYTMICETTKEWLRQWAAVILILEQGLRPQQRLQAQQQYSSSMASNPKRRSLVVRWHLSEKDKQIKKAESDETREEFVKEKLAAQKRAASTEDIQMGLGSEAISVLNMFETDKKASLI